MKKSLILCVALMSLLFMPKVFAEKIGENFTFDPADTCIKEDDAFFKDVKPIIQYIVGNESIENCDNPNLMLKTSITTCELEGWYLDKELTQKVTGTTIGSVLKPIEVKKDASGCLTEYNYITHIYAKCKEVKQCPVDMEYEKNLMYNNDGVITKVNVKNQMNLLTPTKEGYVFDGWYYDDKYTKRVDGSATDSITFKPVYDDDNCITKYEDVVIYAKWSKIPDTCTNKVNTNVNVIYVINENESKKIETNVTNNEPLLSTTKDGYNFLGWFSDKDLKNKVSDLTFVQKFDENNCLIGYEDITLYAKWEKKDETSNITKPDTPKVDNPKTGDNIVLYVVSGVILLAGCVLIIKKLTTK